MPDIPKQIPTCARYVLFQAGRALFAHYPVCDSVSPVHVPSPALTNKSDRLTGLW